VKAPVWWARRARGIHRAGGAVRSRRRLPARVAPRTGARALVAATVGLALLAGCTSARSALGTADSGCYVALPGASRAVHHAGHLLGVRLVDVDSLRAHAPRMYLVARSRPGPKVRRVCLAAFAGHFTSADVAMPAGQPAGRVAIVVIEYPNRRLLGTVILGRAPLRFAHTHLLAAVEGVPGGAGHPMVGA